MEFSVEVLIREAPSRVFKYVADPVKWKEWVTGFQDFHTQKGRRRAVGSTAKHIYREPDGKTTEVLEEVLEKEWNSKLVLLLSHRHMQSQVQYGFYDQGEGSTRLKVVVKIRLRPWAFNLLAPFVSGPMKRRQRADLRKLKAQLES